MFGINIIDDASVAASGLSTAKIAEIKASIEAAAAAWGQYIDAPNAVIDINLTIDDIPGSSLATAGAFYSSTGGGPFESIVTDEFAANADLSPGSADGQLRLDLPRLQDPDFYFFDTSFEADPIGLANDEIDFMSVMVHEFGHILGLSIAPNFTTPFDAMTQVIGGINYFTGANAVAANGGNNVELTGSHLVTEDLLDPTTVSGTRGQITPVHIGMWQDLGVPIVEPSSGADTLYGFESIDDVINASGGNDVVYGLTGDDTLNGGGGNDILEGGDDGDALSGSSGTDAAAYMTATSGLTADLNNTGVNTGDAAGDTYSSIENLIGSAFDDTLRGTSTRNIITGGDGDDIMNGRAGNDILEGGRGADFMNGSTGNDTARYDTASSAVRADLNNSAVNTGDAAGDRYASVENLSGSKFDDNLRGTSADNTLTGGNGHDRLFGRGGDDVLDGGKGSDLLVGSAGDDALYGRAGNDILDGGKGGDLLVGSTGIDTARYSSAKTAVEADLGNAANNTGDAAGDSYSGIENLLGSKFDDTLRGTSGDNELTGGRGDDEVFGRGGADVLDGGRGDDVLDGGGGADTFSFRSNDGTDTIQDFDDGTDVIRLVDTGLAFGDLNISNAGGGVTEIDYGSGVISVNGVGAGSFSAADFEFV